VGSAFTADQFIAEFFEWSPFAPGLELPELPAVGGLGAPGVGRRAGQRGEGLATRELDPPVVQDVAWCSVPRWAPMSVSPAFSSPADISRGTSIP
jgi:hypothetical protein